MTNFQNDLNCQDLPSHKRLLSDIYSSNSCKVDDSSFEDASDMRLNYDLILNRTKKNGTVYRNKIECKTCYAKTTNIAIEMVAAVDAKLLPSEFHAKGKQVRKSDRYRPLLERIIKDVENGISNSKKGMILSHKVNKNAFIDNHNLSYLRPEKRAIYLFHTERLMQWIVDENFIDELPYFITYTGHGYNHCTIGLLIPESKIFHYNNSLPNSESIILAENKSII